MRLDEEARFRTQARTKTAVHLWRHVKAIGNG
jgi:hypothetical protein